MGVAGETAAEGKDEGCQAGVTQEGSGDEGHEAGGDDGEARGEAGGECGEVGGAAFGGGRVGVYGRFLAGLGCWAQQTRSEAEW